MPGLPLYNAEINPTAEDETGVFVISVVGEPAIQSNFSLFSEGEAKPRDWQVLNLNAEQMRLKTEPTKQILIGAALIPGQIIYRDNINGAPGAFTTSKEMILAAKKSFDLKGSQFQTNFDHLSTYPVKCSVESLIVKQNSFADALDLNLPEGTWLVCMYIEDEQFWKTHVLTGHVKGFSVEMFCNMIKIADSIDVPLSVEKPSQSINEDLLLFKSVAINGGFNDCDFSIDRSVKTEIEKAALTIDPKKISLAATSVLNDLKTCTHLTASGYAELCVKLSKFDTIDQQAVGGFTTAYWLECIGLECQLALFLERQPQFLARNRSAFDSLFEEMSKKAALRWVRQLRAYAAKATPNAAKKAMSLIQSLQDSLSADDVEGVLSKFSDINKLFV